jgi:hypothetical protein
MKLNRWIPSGLATVALACTAGLATASAQTTNLISNTTFELTVTDAEGNVVTPGGEARYPWAYTYAGGGMEDPGGFREANVVFGIPEDNPTNILTKFSFETTAYTPVPAGAWYGFGFGAGMNWNSFDPAVLSTNREDYVISFDARAEGLLPGVATANGEMQVQMDAPDDTIQPADSNGDADRLIQANVNFAVGTNWTHYRIPLDPAGIGGGSDKNLKLYGLLMNSMNYNVNFNAPGDAFGFDADNAVYLDNVRLEVVRKAVTNAPPSYGVTIANWNFDDKPTDYNYEYGWTEKGSQPTMTGNRAAEGYGVGGSNAWILQMDNSALANDNPAWAGGGTGGGGPVDFTQFNTSDLASYKFSVDARVEGLNPEKFDTTGVLQIFLDTPDDTLQPADENTDNDGILRLDFQLAGLETNWQTMTFTLAKGNVGSGSKDNFIAHYNKINGFRTQWQVENAASVADWNYDADNALVIDNFKLERIYTGAPAAAISLANGEVTITWSGQARLQSASSLEGPYTDVAGATSPYKASPTGNARFFRTVQ